jgi:WD40 repeat protein
LPVSGRLVKPERFASGLALSRGYRVYWFEDGEGPALGLDCPTYGCVAVAFDGARATTMRYEGSAWRRDLTSESGWQSLWPERRQGRDVIYFSLALAPDGQRAALGMTDCTVELVGRAGPDGPTLRPALSAEEIERQRVYAVAFSPDGALLAAGAGRSGFVDDPREEWFGRGGGLYLYDVARAELLAAFPTPRDDITALAFAPDGSLLFAGSTDCTIRVVDVQTRQEVAVLSGHIGGVNGLTFSPDGQLLASAGGDGLVRLWPWRQLLGRPAPTAAPPARRRKRS